MFTDIFSYPFMERALISAILTALACGIIGVFVIMRGLSFMGAGIAHSAFAGAVLGILIGINPLITALLFSLILGFGVGYTTRKGHLREDVSIGMLFSLMMALAIVFIKLLPGYNSEAYSYLFGDVLGTSWDSMIMISLMAITVVAVSFAFFKEFQAIIFDEEMALAMGLPVSLIFYTLLSLIAITIVASMSTVGAVLVFALITAPAAAAYQLTHRMGYLIILSVIFAEISAVGGIFTSAMFEFLPPGSLIVFYAVAIFFIAMYLSPKRRRLKSTGKRYGEAVDDKA